jgi:hypothetical protein
MSRRTDDLAFVGTGVLGQATVAPPANVSATDLREGTRIRQYELIREIGRGGMGQVFLARDTKLGRRVAMKFLFSQSAEVTERFLVEARTTARCNHENIVVIHEADEYQGQPYMVLEYLEGSMLRSLMEGQRLNAGRAVELMVPVVRALVRAHEFDIVHRDLKPENIVVTNAGGIKVLDFGIARLFSDPSDKSARDGALMGTLPYMSPEQFGMDEVDARTDLWAVGIMLYEMVAGKHPLGPLIPTRLFANAGALDSPMPSVAAEVPELPQRLEEVIDRCLKKRKAQRFSSARELLDALEPLLPRRYGRQLGADESPFPGLTAFQESDADRFFGRAQDVARLTTTLRERALVGILGPSGIGKSSLVRAGVVPALKSSGESWEVFVLRPGRNPLAGAANLLVPLMTTDASGDSSPHRDPDALARKLRHEPGYFGAFLRQRAARKQGRILVFVDQFEELYTLVPEASERAAFTACLRGIADDVTAPLRVIVSMRSDFLDRVSEDRRFLDDLTRGLVFLQPLGREGLLEALVQPIEMLGYRYEVPELAREMVDALAATTGALPLLQFAAAKLWENRDRRRKFLTRASYSQMDGISGALATHADQVVGGLPSATQKLARSLFQRLVTPERTRAIVDVSELRSLSADPAQAQGLIDHLVRARLLVVQTRSEAEGASVEIVHESLIDRWPTLRRWLDEGQEDAAFLAQLREAAKQWDAKARPQGLLWRGEAHDEALRWHRRAQGKGLAAREAEYLRAVFDLGARTARRKRELIAGGFLFLSALVAVGAIALVQIRQGKKDAQTQAMLATAAQTKVQQQLDQIRAEEQAKQAAEKKAEAASAEVAMSKEELKAANDHLRVALADSVKAQASAVEAAQKEKRAADENRKLASDLQKRKAELERLLAVERERAEEAAKERKRISRELK